jgi:hypothetical protein
MAVAFRSSATAKYATVTNITVTKPAGTVDGDMLIAFLSVGGAGIPTVGAPAGWTLHTTYTDITAGGFTVRNFLYWKAASGEGANWQWTFTLSNAECSVLALTGADPTTPIPSAPSSTQGASSGGATTTTFPTVTTPRDNSMVIAYGQDWGDASVTLTAPTGSTPTFTERITCATSSIQSISTGVLATAGATGAKTQINNCTINLSPWMGSLVIIQSPSVTAAFADQGSLGSIARS